MKQLIVLGALIPAFLITSCKKDTPEETEKVPVISITGYSPTDAFANSTGTSDPSDWLTAETWPDKVYELMNAQADPHSYENISDIPDASGFSSYPNPATTQSGIVFTLTDNAVVKFMLVDEYLNIVAFHSGKFSKGSNTLTLSMPDNLISNKLYRLYYAGYNNNKKMRFNGHGDIMKN